ncbi:MAG TPA: DNA starvation/stationary phase protection protein [Gammaproteobacteria bacterium]
MKGYAAKKTESRSASRQGAVATPTDLPHKDAVDVAQALNGLLADVFALYVKTKNFHWHVSGPHFRDYHLLLDQQATQILAMVDPIAERVRKLGQSTLKSIGHIGRLQRVRDNDGDDLDAEAMLSELLDDNRMLVGRLREAHELCDQRNDVATASLIEVWIDETEERAWFLHETLKRTG